MLYELTKEHLTDDDLKVIKHMRAINKLFMKGNLTVTSLFADNGTMKLVKNIDGTDYTVESYYDITCDGGDPDRSGQWGLHSEDELEEYYENE